MKIIIIGGGNVGYYLTKTLTAENHRIMIVETDHARCEQIAAEMNARHAEIMQGDGTNMESLREAGIFTADVLIAVTGHDQNNLVACQLAKDYFGVKQTIARVKNPKNISVFQKLGVDSVISSTEQIAGIINRELDWVDVNKLLKDKKLNMRLREVTVERDSAFENKCLKDLRLPKGLILIAVLRGEQAIIPGGETCLKTGDTMIVWGDGADISSVFDCYAGKRGA